MFLLIVLTFSTDFSDLIVSLHQNQVQTPRLIVYCQSLNMCADLYAHFHFELGSSSYYPDPQYNKDVILKSLGVPDGTVRVVFATVALGMGIDLKDINSVIHYGAPRSIEDYFQESGRGGRSGEKARSTIYWCKPDCPVRTLPTTMQHQEVIAVRRYLENTTSCRRKQLLEYFTPDCAKPGPNPLRCCDFCASDATPPPPVTSSPLTP